MTVFLAFCAGVVCGMATLAGLAVVLAGAIGGAMREDEAEPETEF
jgi:hypothetical protein